MKQSPEQGTVETEVSREDSRLSEFTVPVLREELEIRKEVHHTGTVRLRKVISESPEFISEVLGAENIEIERIPMDVLVDAPPPVRTEGDVTVIPIVEEVLVVTKQIRLKEEVRISRRHSASNYYEEIRLRSEELVVERADAEKPTRL